MKSRCRFQMLLPGLLVLLAMTPLVAQSAGGLAHVTILQAGRLLDPVSGRILQNPLIVVEDGRITVVEENGHTPGSNDPRFKNAKTRTSIDLGAGTLTLMPGLVDSHSHNLLQPEDEVTAPVLTKSQAFRTVQGVAAARKNLEAGFTTMRDLDSEGAGFADVALRDAINQGIVPGPRLQVATYALTITGGHMNLSGMNPDLALPDPATLTDSRSAMIAEVRREVKYGADWIKLYATGTLRHVDPATLEPLAQVSLDDVQAVVAEAARWRKDVAAHAYGGAGARNAVEGGVRSIEHGMMLDADTLGLMVKRGTFYVPTLSVYMPEPGAPPDDFKNRIVARHKQAFQAAMAAGVKIVFGTDVGAFPHGTGAREFGHMVRYGMSPLEAIRSATTRAAELLRMEDQIGAVAPGHRADIIGVDGDPLKDISALSRVVFVMKDGEVFKRTKPDAMSPGTKSQ